VIRSRRMQYLEAMDIRLWERRIRGSEAPDVFNMPARTAGSTPEMDLVPEPVSPAGEPAPSAPSALADDIGRLGWEELAARVLACTRCRLAESRTQGVFGVGSHTAQWMIIGEAPGADEDRRGEPFVGKAGQLLNEMLLAMGLKREEVYIANVIKSRPPNNREPMPEEIAACRPYLRRQIELLKPRIILAVGRISAQSLLNTKSNIGPLRGRRFSDAETGIPIVVTYHPAYLLRSPLEKRKVWQDLLLARRVFREVAG